MSAKITPLKKALNIELHYMHTITKALEKENINYNLDHINIITKALSKNYLYDLIELAKELGQDKLVKFHEEALKTLEK